VPIALAVGAITACVAALFGSRLSGTPQIPVLPGLPDAGEFTRLAMPLARTAFDVVAVGLCGSLLLGLVLLPRRHADLALSIEAAMRSAARCAWALAATAVALLLLTLSEVLARPLPRVLSWDILGQFAYSFDATRALMSSALLAVLTAVAAGSEASRATRTLTGLLAAATLIPPLLAGHSGHARYHYLAVASLSVHVLSASIWIGGLLALALALGRGRGPAGHTPLVTALPRFSRVALFCCVAVGLSGAVNAWIRLATVDQLWLTPYGRLILAKTAALVVLAGFGWWHRRRTIQAVRDRRPRAFVLLAAVEVAIMLTTVGLAVALARTPPPTAPGHARTSAAGLSTHLRIFQSDRPVATGPRSPEHNRWGG